MSNSLSGYTGIPTIDILNESEDSEPEPIESDCIGQPTSPTISTPEGYFLPWDEILTTYYILLFLLLIAHIITGLIFIDKYRNLCKGHSQLWIFSIILETIPLGYGCLVEYMLPNWNPALTGKRHAAYTTCALFIVVYASAVLYDPSKSCPEEEKSALYYWVVINNSCVMLGLICSLIYAIFKFEVKIDNDNSITNSSSNSDFENVTDRSKLINSK